MTVRRLNAPLQAALTGHLVFSTLHTNNAATCLPRLLDMGVEPFLIASTVRVVVGQRLVRRLCPVCREAYVPDAGLLERIKTNFNLKNEADVAEIHKLEKSAHEAGIGVHDTGSNEKSSAEKLSIMRTHSWWKALHEGGCGNCNHIGYRGRMGIYEVLSNSTEIQRSIVGNSTSEVLQDVAIKEGMVTMHVDGFIKALRGQTTLEEIIRTTSIEG